MFFSSIGYLKLNQNTSIFDKLIGIFHQFSKTFGIIQNSPNIKTCQI